jgi:hypothetical protein
MIDTRFIVRYTNGLYATPEKSRPRYDEFRDMFSSGQLASKEWAVRELLKVVDLTFQHVLIAGCWFGTLGMMIKTHSPTSTVTMLDIDPRCAEFIEHITAFETNVFAKVGDMYKYDYKEDIVINTSCEHIEDVGGWLKLLPKGTTVLLQSNSNAKEQGHVNCVQSCEEFEKQAGLSTVLYSDKLVTPMYTRFMLIGKT